MINNNDWLVTGDGDPRGYIEPDELKELWFNTGTLCNLSCKFCFEGASPSSNRLEQVDLDDIKPYIDEAVELGIEKFSFTGGEPFVNRDFVAIIRYALEFRPCLVLTNATEPLINKIDQIAPLVSSKNQLSFRVSLDSPIDKEHDSNRGEGHFEMALQTLKKLYDIGFKISVARLAKKGERKLDVDNMYKELLTSFGLPAETNIISFPDLLSPCSHPDVSQITENCMTTYKTEDERKSFMCNYSKMVVKKAGGMGVYACTLVDDDDGYDLGSSLSDAMKQRVMLRHHRCFTCFSSGTSCSEG